MKEKDFSRVGSIPYSFFEGSQKVRSSILQGKPPGKGYGIRFYKGKLVSLGVRILFLRDTSLKR